jgi:hypothetical protein
VRALPVRVLVVRVPTGAKSLGKSFAMLPRAL